MFPASMTLPGYIVKNSRIHGRGLFASRLLASGEIVAEYTGERLDKNESARRQAMNRAIFIFELDENYDLDGDSPGNHARFANHSCEPNCEAVAAHGRVRLRALRRIEPEEELTFDYGFPLAVFPGHPCRCGAPSCCGFIVSDPDRWRVRRLLNRPGRSLLHGCPPVRKEVCA